MRKTILRHGLRSGLLAAAALLPAPLLAHGLHDRGSFLAGAAHPLSGADHVLAMLAVGLLAAQTAAQTPAPTGARALWAMPLTFLGAMLAGGAIGAAGLAFPAVEPMILASVILLGALVAMAMRLSPGIVLPLLVLFGAAHGWAHGAEGPAEGMAPYAVGLAVMTATLHGLGIGLGKLLHGLALRGLGLLAGLGGLALALA